MRLFTNHFYHFSKPLSVKLTTHQTFERDKNTWALLVVFEAALIKQFNLYISHIMSEWTWFVSIGVRKQINTTKTIHNSTQIRRPAQYFNVGSARKICKLRHDLLNKTLNGAQMSERRRDKPTGNLFFGCLLTTQKRVVYFRMYPDWERNATSLFILKI